MLSTLSMFLMALSVIKKRGLTGLITAEKTGLQRDLKFFLFVFSLVFLSVFLSDFKISMLGNYIIAIALATSYFLYILITIKESSKLVATGHNTVADKKLFITYFLIKNNSVDFVAESAILL